MTSTEKLHTALRDRRWSEKDLAWTPDLPVETATDRMRKPCVRATLTLRLEAALEISAIDGYAVSVEFRTGRGDEGEADRSRRAMAWADEQLGLR